MGSDKIDITRYGYTILQIETMSACNMRCKFCAYPDRPDKGDVLPDDNVRGVIDALQPSAGFEYICFSQFNEPLLDKRIYGFIEYARKKGFPVLLITNGLILREEGVIDKVLTCGADRIKISLQTANEEMFRHSRGVAGISFDEYRKWLYVFLSRARDYPCEVTVDVACNFLSGMRKFKSSLLGLDRGDPSVYDTVDDLKADIHSFLRGLQQHDRRFDLDEDVLNEFLEKAGLDYVQEEGFPIGGNVQLKIKPFMQGDRLTHFYPVEKSCGCSNRILGILASGNVVPCCLAYGDLLRMGNIKDRPLKAILDENAALLGNIRKGEHLPLVCQKCLGAPTPRGAFVKSLKNTFSKP